MAMHVHGGHQPSLDSNITQVWIQISPVGLKRRWMLCAQHPSTFQNPKS